MTRWAERISLTLTGLLVLAIFSQPYAYFESSLDVRRSIISPGFDLHLPDGEGPHPTVILFHGCGGLVGTDGPKLIMDRYAAAANEAGLAALVVDSFGPRGIGFTQAVGQVCTGFRLQAPNRAGDVFAALDWVRDQPELDADRIGLAGWSHGGWTLMETGFMDLDHYRPRYIRNTQGMSMDGVRAMHLTYPYCGFPARAAEGRWVYDLRYHVVYAGLDTMSAPDTCRDAMDNARQNGFTVSEETIPGVTHAFDEEDQREGSAYIYDEAAASAAMQRFAAWMAEALAAD